MCEVTVTPIVHRTQRTVKVVEPVMGVNPIVTSLTLGVLGVGMGALAYTQADYLSRPENRSDMTMGDPQAIRQAGLAIVGLGAILLTIGGIDAWRAADDATDLEDVRSVGVRSVSPCPIQPFGNQLIHVRLEGVDPIWRSDAYGRVRLPMRRVPTAALPQGAHPFLAWFGDFRPAQVSLDDRNWNALTLALLQDPQSRVYEEALEGLSAPPSVTGSPSATPPPGSDLREPVPAAEEANPPAVDNILKLIEKCKGQGSAGDVARAYAGYKALDGSDLEPATKRVWEMEIQSRCKADRRRTEE